MKTRNSLNFFLKQVSYKKKPRKLSFVILPVSIRFFYATSIRIIIFS